jgi:hypothetical protein
LKDNHPGILILKETKAEYAKLQWQEKVLPRNVANGRDG